MAQVIIVGGGLAGLSAAHTVLERGGRVCIIDKNAFLGGNSTKATSGINGALTSTQQQAGVPDSREIFFNDICSSAGEGLREPLARVLAYESGPSIEWLKDSFELDLSKVGFMGGHSQMRTHRGEGGRFPGAMITMTLMEKYDDIQEKYPERARLIPKAQATELITAADGSVVGCRYKSTQTGELFEEHGTVILSTGGFGADFTDESLLADVSAEWRGLAAWKGQYGHTVPDDILPDLRSLPTTNGDHCTGDGIKLGLAAGASTCDMECVQVRDPSPRAHCTRSRLLPGARDRRHNAH
jgi:succinate dehydrogenase/fumarate reductase flavoprotein subunit